MCGIIYVNKERGSAAKPVWKRYLRQRERGKDGFGFVSIENEAVRTLGRDITDEGIHPKMLQCKESSMLFHHRKPTSTDNFEEATHPIFVSNKVLKHDYFIIHNGVIRNPDVRKKEHEELGFEYTTEMETHATVKRKIGGKVLQTKEVKSEYNDSEALAIDIALYAEEWSDVIESYGTIAFIALQVEKGGDKILNMLYAHNSGNPLTIEKRKGFFSITSVGGQYSVPVDVLHTYNYSTGDTETIGLDLRLSGYMAPRKPHTPSVTPPAKTKERKWRSKSKKKRKKGAICDHCNEPIRFESYINGLVELCITCYGEATTTNTEESNHCMGCHEILESVEETRLLHGYYYCSDCYYEAQSQGANSGLLDEPVFNYDEIVNGHVESEDPKTNQLALPEASHIHNTHDLGKKMDEWERTAYRAQLLLQLEKVTGKIQELTEEMVNTRAERDSYREKDDEANVETWLLVEQLKEDERKLTNLQISENCLQSEIDELD